MDITQVCFNCQRGRKVYHISLDLYDDNGILHRGVEQMKEFEFECEYCFRKSFFNFYRLSHPDVILLLKRLDRKQNELLNALNSIIDILEKYIKS